MTDHVGAREDRGGARSQPLPPAAATSLEAARPPRMVPPSHGRVCLGRPRRWVADSVLGLRWLR